MHACIQSARWSAAAGAGGTMRTLLHRRAATCGNSGPSVHPLLLQGILLQAIVSLLLHSPFHTDENPTCEVHCQLQSNALTCALVTLLYSAASAASAAAAAALASLGWPETTCSSIPRVFAAAYCMRAWFEPRRRPGYQVRQADAHTHTWPVLSDRHNSSAGKLS